VAIAERCAATGLEHTAAAATSATSYSRSFVRSARPDHALPMLTSTTSRCCCSCAASWTVPSLSALAAFAARAPAGPTSARLRASPDSPRRSAGGRAWPSSRATDGPHPRRSAGAHGQLPRPFAYASSRKRSAAVASRNSTPRRATSKHCASTWHSDSNGEISVGKTAGELSRSDSSQIRRL